MSIEILIAHAAKHFAAGGAAEDHLAAESNKGADLKRQKAENDAKLARYEEAEEADAARRILDGPDAAPEKGKRVAAIRNMRDRRPQLTAAVTLQQRRIEEARDAIAPLLPPLAEASLRVVAEVQANAVAEIKTVLSGLSEPAARLIAGDQILAAMLGTGGFVIPPGAPMPINGGRLLSSLFEHLPGNVRPEAFDAATIFEAARAISQPILSTIKGQSQ